MLYFENAPLDFLVTSVIDLRKSGWCHVTCVLLALFQYWLNNPDYEMKFNERELLWQNKQLEGVYANESSLANQNEPHAQALTRVKRMDLQVMLYNHKTKVR